MEFTYQGRRYIVSWSHHDDTVQYLPRSGKDAAATVMNRLHHLPEDRQREIGLPYKTARVVNGKRVYFNGVTICLIKALRADADTLPPHERWETVAEGYAFKRSDDLTFNKREARKRSLAKALKDGCFKYSGRTHVWTQFNLIWPPFDPDATAWEKRYQKTKAQLVQAENQIVELMRQLRERGHAETTL